MTAALRKAIHWVEQGFVADAVIRAGIRRLCQQRLQEIGADDREAAALAAEAFVAAMDAADIAPLPHLANEQHYDVPARTLSARGSWAKRGGEACATWMSSPQT